MVIQKPQLSRKLISPSRLIPQRRCRTRPVRRPRHSRWSVPVHRANCRDPHRRVMEVSRDAVAWDMGRAASAGSRAAGPRSPAQAKPRPGEAPPRCSGSWETRPSPRKGLPGRMLVQDETRLWDSGPGEPRPPAMQPQVRGPLRPSSPGPWLRWGRLRPLRVAGLSALRIPVQQVESAQDPARFLWGSRQVEGLSLSPLLVAQVTGCGRGGVLGRWTVTCGLC